MIFFESDRLTQFFKVVSCSDCASVHTLAISSSINADAKWLDNLDSVDRFAFRKLPFAKRQYKRFIREYIRHEKQLVKILYKRHALHISSCSYQFEEHNFNNFSQS